MQKIIFFIAAIALSCSVSAQQKFTLSGTVRDLSSGEDLIGATVRLLESPSSGRISNEYGFYSLTVPSGTYTVQCSYIGYQKFSKTVVLDKDLKFDIQLSTDALLEEVVVSAKSDVCGARMPPAKLHACQHEQCFPSCCNSKNTLK